MKLSMEGGDGGGAEAAIAGQRQRLVEHLWRGRLGAATEQGHQHEAEDGRLVRVRTKISTR